VIGLRPLIGHEDARRALARAADRGDLPGSLLIYGPPGIGRQRLGLWLAQRLLCAAPRDPEPCGQCQACRAAIRLEHPDLHWFFPLPRPKSGTRAEKLGDALEEARAAELASRRQDPYRPHVPGEAVGIYLAQIQVLRQYALARPAAGSHKVFLIGDAEYLVPQEASPEAANALLKLLEEPPPATTLILTATSPDSLLPTVRSRLLPVRLRPLPDSVVERFLVDEVGADPGVARAVARLANGSIGMALGFLPSSDGAGPLESLRRQARAWLEAAVSSSPRDRYAAAHRLAPTGARGSFADALGFLSLWVRDLTAFAAGAETALFNADAARAIAAISRRCPAAGRGGAIALAHIDEAIRMGRTNVNPQLTLAWLLARVHDALVRGR